MSCCCRSLEKVIDMPPVPPPLCSISFERGFIIRRGTASDSGTSPSLSAVNDAAWSTFNAAPWTHPTISAGGTLLGADALDTGYGAAGFGPTFDATFVWARGDLNNENITGITAQYREIRMWVTFSVTIPGDDGPLSLLDLYGLQSFIVDLFMRLMGGSATSSRSILQSGFFGPEIARDDVTYSASQAWSTIDVSWGDGAVPGLTPLTFARLNAFYAFIGGGLTDQFTNSLLVDQAVDNAGTAPVPPSVLASITPLDLSALGGETFGNTRVTLLFQVSPDQIVQQAPSLSEPAAWGDDGGVILLPKQYHGFGPCVGANTFRVGLNTLVSRDSAITNLGDALRVLPLIWGCVQNLTVDVDIAQDASAALEETPTMICIWTSGANLAKTFSDLLTTAGAGTIVEWLNPDDNIDTNWAVFDHAGLDKSSEYPATPSASTAVEYGPFDDGEEQAYVLEPLTGPHTSGAITITAFVYNSATDKDAETVQVAYGNNGSYTADEDLFWDNADDGWRTAVLGTGLGTADFLLPQIRLTAPGGVGFSGGKVFEAIRLKVESEGDTTQITRVLTIFLTEEAGPTFWLNFQFHRFSDPNQEETYIEPSDPFKVQVGPGTSYETLGDLIDVPFVFPHDGDDNVTPANGTEDVILTFTIRNITI